MATRWIKEREAELKAPGAMLTKEKSGSDALADALDRCIKDNEVSTGRTKRSTLNAIKRDEIAKMQCDAITSIHICDVH